MKYGSLILEKKEYVYLKRILNILGYAEDHETQKGLIKLSEELQTAHVVDEEDMPSDVIRFNTTVTVAFESDVEKKIQVVIPMDKDFQKNKISILTPLGSALIGYSKGDTVLWDFPSGKQNIKITEVEQEAVYKGIDLAI
ncbi:MAG: transcription elongation factor GreAB [Algicola sp.]|nr:transcription elongation factor GreAB [Algicola sp.]